MRVVVVALAVVVAVAVSHAPPARACGATFCSPDSLTTAPVPVDQTAERILFEIEEDGSVTTTVEISYTGAPQTFSWIVPVPETPTLSVVPANTLLMLDEGTRPRITPPAQVCTRPPPPPRPLIPPLFPTCSVPAPSNADWPVDGEDENVDVESLPRVGPYDDIVVVEATDPDTLVTWLNDNGYLVTPSMAPVIAQYVEEGFKFLAVKLAPDVGVNDIAPLRFTCPGQDGSPIIPLRLTGIAASPEMSIVVMIAGAERYAPASYREIELTVDEIKASESTGQSNYHALASWRIDQEGGKAFIVESAGPTDQMWPGGSMNDRESSDAALAILDRYPWLTRLYTRMSGWEMDEDPVFLARGSDEVVSRDRDLPGRGQEVCSQGGQIMPPRQRCGDLYCGVGSHCAEAGVSDGCVCAEGTFARRVMTPSGPSVFCQERSLDFLSSLSSLAGICEQATCGDNGTCRVVNGFATCECDDGFAAIASEEAGSEDTGIRCRTVRRLHEPTALLWPDYEPAGATLDEEAGGCDSTAAQGPKSLAFFLSFMWGAMWLLRRTLRRVG